MMRFIIKNSIGKYLLFALLALIFVAGGIFILSVGKDLKATIIGWSCIIFFGFGLFVFIWQIFDTRPRIVIDEIGIYDRTLGVGIIEWEDIEHAYLNSIYGNDFISLILRDTEKYLQRISKPKAKLAKYNKALGFETINLNLSGVNVKTKEIFDLIIKQLIKTKIKGLKNLEYELKLQNPDKRNVVSDRPSDS